MLKKFKRLYAVLLSVVIVFTGVFALDITVASAATSGTCGTSATWSYNASTTTLTISGTGATKDYNAAISKVPWESYKPNITRVVVNEGITAIGYYNFYNCVNLVNVSLPSTLTELRGMGTMTTSYGCFQACTSLQSITLPANLQSIGNCVFKGCTSLKVARIPNSVTNISYGAFCECPSLETVIFGSGLTKTGENAFYNSGVKRITWGANITEISMYSFYGCKMTSIDIPDSVTSIGLRALATCSFLTSVTVNNANMSFTGDPCDGSEQALTIYGHRGSTAETYANDKNYTFVSIDACDHLTTHDVITKESTCLEKGIISHICDDCGAVVTQTPTDALGHNYEEIERVDNTNTDGHIYTTDKCTRCDTIKDNIIHQRTPEGSDSKTRYIWVDGYYEYTNTATCTRPGVARYTCTVEGCKMLGTLQTQETVDVSLSNHQIDEYVVITAPTCTEAGEEEGECTVCSEKIKRNVPATGHYYTDDDIVVILDNTEDDGHIHTVYECEYCNEQIPESEHIEWIDGCYTAEIISAARCIIDGLERDTCDICGISRNVVLKANGQHEWYETGRTAPTCSAVGKTYYACRNCDLTRSENIEALGHDYVKDENSSTAPSCTVNGTDYFKCSRCSASKSVTVPSLGHTVNENIYTVISEPTCIEDGSAVSICLVCGQEFTKVLTQTGHDYQEIAVDLTNEGKPGHSLVTPTCSVCGERKSATMRHDEWIENYYTNADTMESTCNVQGFTTDTCTICNTTRRNLKPTLGHIYNVTGVVDEFGVQYRCSICLRSAYFDADDVYAHWDSSLLCSKVINRSGPENQDYTSMLDANGDGIINGKDFAILRLNVKKQAKAREEAENAQPIGVRIIIGESEFEAVFNTSKAARDFVKLLPATMNMIDVGGNEKDGIILSQLTQSEEEIEHINCGDIMLKGSNRIAIFYDSFDTEASYTKLGTITDPEGLAEALSGTTVSVTFEIIGDDEPETDEEI